MTVEIEQLAERILGVKNPEGFEQALGVELVERESTEWLEEYRGTFERGPFLWADLRVNRMNELMFLVLHVRQDLGLTIGDVNLKRWGTAPTSIDVNPDIPPEGTTGFLYQPHGVTLTFTFTTRSRLLRQISFKWPARR